MLLACSMNRMCVRAFRSSWGAVFLVLVLVLRARSERCHWTTARLASVLSQTSVRGMLSVWRALTPKASMHSL